MPVSLKALISCFLRSYLTGAAFNTRGMQNIGLGYAIDPGLQEIYSDPVSLQKARRRHIRLYNTHPLWNPLLIGLFLALESKISRNLFPAPTMPRVKSTLVFTLSAIGDSFFSGSFLVTWSLTTILLLFLDLHTLAVLLALGVFLLIQLFKLYTFYMGATQGLIFINRLKKWNLINWGSRLKICNAFLVLAFWLVIWPFNWQLYNFIPVAAVGLVLTCLYRNIMWAREIILACIMLILLFSPDFMARLQQFINI